MLKLSNLSVGFGGPDQVLADVRLSLDEGQRLMVSGAAGSGKTTLLNAAAGLIPRLIPVASLAGSIELKGRALSAMTRDDLYRAIGFASRLAGVGTGPGISWRHRGHDFTAEGRQIVGRPSPRRAIPTNRPVGRSRHSSAQSGSLAATDVDQGPHAARRLGLDDRPEA